MSISAVISLGSLGFLFGCILAYAGQKFEVEVDPRIEKIKACLIGANCGACGYGSCAQFAEAVVAGEAPSTGCRPGRAKVAEKIAEIMAAQKEEG
ncbi:MAG: RnfABCDGE type electron transport complex subunit B [Firmicutes bacterium]|jgi:electron transport complex protein RnfB|nr:RnfABCDGE type electron transport complex subunit B [Bacillota bacterium]